jgi:hypothetical protein
MEETAKSRECFVCQGTSEDRVLVPCEDRGEDKWVCVRCLPPLIHGMG